MVPCQDAVVSGRAKGRGTAGQSVDKAETAQEALVSAREPSVADQTEKGGHGSPANAGVMHVGPQSRLLTTAEKKHPLWLH